MLVFHSSTITMMHGPINTRFFWDIESPYKGTGGSLVRNAAMLCVSVLVLCLESGVFVLKLKGIVFKGKP